MHYHILASPIPMLVTFIGIIVDLRFLPQIPANRPEVYPHSTPFRAKNVSNSSAITLKK